MYQADLITYIVTYIYCFLEEFVSITPHWSLLLWRVKSCEVGCISPPPHPCLPHQNSLHTSASPPPQKKEVWLRHCFTKISVSVKSWVRHCMVLVGIAGTNIPVQYVADTQRCNRRTLVTPQKTGERRRGGGGRPIRVSKYLLILFLIQWYMGVGLGCEMCGHTHPHQLEFLTSYSRYYFFFGRNSLIDTIL